MIDATQFAGNDLMLRFIGELNELLDRCGEFIDNKLPSTTYSHVKTHMELADKLQAEVIQKIAELSMGYHLNEKKLSSALRDLTYEAWEEFGRNRYFAENVVNGNPAIADLMLLSKCFKSGIEALDKFSWVIKSNKEHVVEMYQKTK